MLRNAIIYILSRVALFNTTSVYMVLRGAMSHNRIIHMLVHTTLFNTISFYMVLCSTMSQKLIIYMVSRTSNAQYLSICMILKRSCEPQNPIVEQNNVFTLCSKLFLSESCRNTIIYMPL